MKLRYRLSFLIGIAALIPLGFTGIASTRIANRHHVEQTRELYGKQAEGLALLALTWLEQQLRSLEVAVDLFEVERLEPAEQEGLLKFIYRQFDGINIVVLRNAGGLPVTAPLSVSERTDLPGDVHQVVDSARLEQFLERLPHKDALINGVARGTVYTPEGASAPVIPVAIRTHGAVPYVVGVELSLSQLVEHFLNQRSAGGALVLVGPSGEVLAGEPGQLVRTEILAGFRGGVEGDLSYELPDGTPVLAAFASVGDTPWHVVVATPEAIATAAGREIGNRTWFMVVLAMITALGMGLVGARQIASPVIDLKDAALKVAEGDLGLRLEGSGSREIVELTRAFNFMSSRLARDQEEIASKNAEIQAFNEELQDRVERRTQELREAQARLVESSRMTAVAQMGAGLAHELNNPVAGILGLAQLAQAKSKDDASTGMLKSIEEQAQRCREILSALSRFTGDERPVEWTRIGFLELAKDVRELSRGAFSDARLELAIEGESGPDVEVDAPLMAQALVQLLTSIRSELAPGGTITLSACKESGDACLCISLQGELQPRGDDWLASGMGYWVARRVLGEHGGRLVEPEEQEDSVYRIFLPLV